MIYGDSGLVPHNQAQNLLEPVEKEAYFGRNRKVGDGLSREDEKPVGIRTKKCLMPHGRVGWVDPSGMGVDRKWIGHAGVGFRDRSFPDASIRSGSVFVRAAPLFGL